MRWSKILLVWVVALIAASAFAQSNRYVVSFKDKNNSPYSIAAPSEFLSARSIARRDRQNIDLTQEDLPVNPQYITELAATGVKVRYTSRWRNSAFIEADASGLALVNSLPFVSQVEYVGPPKPGGGRTRKIRDSKESNLASATQIQLGMLGMIQMHDDNLHGEGIIVAVFDSGFQGVNTAEPFSGLVNEGRIHLQYDFVGHGTDVFKYDDHGTEVLSVMAAFSMAKFTGGAYKANYELFVTEDVTSEFRVEEYNWLFAAERADSAGVDIINSSLGYNWFDDSTMDYTKDQLDGETAIVSWAASRARDRGILVVCSAGNEATNSWKLVTPPADAAGILAVGAISAAGFRLNFSSVGPTSDNRIKPDVVALGSGTSVIKPSGSLGTSSGTSVASPLVASLAAGLWQLYPELTVDQLYQAIIHSADKALSPDSLKGYGLPHYQAVKNFIEAKEGIEDVVVYPNPATATVKLLLAETDTEPVEVTIFDLAGRLVNQSTVSLSWINNPSEYDVSFLPAGLYVLRIRSTHINKTIRLIKE